MEEDDIFKEIPQNIKIARYHSLAGDKATLPDCLKVIAETADGEIMAIKFEGVTYNFNKKKQLDNVNLEIEDNKITGIIGKTGSGKTFLASLLSAINVPISGTITVKDFIFGKNSNIKKLNEYRKIIGYSSQNPREQFLWDTVENELI